MMKWALWIVGSLILAPVLVIGGGFGFLQTGAGKAWLAHEIGAMLSDQSERMTVAGIHGLVPFDFRVRTIEISDPDGPRVVADNVAIAISASDLLARRLTLRRIHIDRLALLRPSQAGGNADWQELLRPPLPISVAALDIDALEFGAPMLGSAMTLTLHGSTSAGGGSAAAKLSLRRIDGTPGAVTLDAAFGGTPLHLQLDAQVSEPTGTVLPALLHRNDTLPLALTLAGNGPLDDWQGKLRATAGAEAALDATVHIAGAEPYHLSVSADAHVGPLLPPEAARIVGDRVAVTAQLSLATEAVSVDRAHITTGSFALDGTGRYASATDAVTGEVHLDVADLSRILPDLHGSGDARVSIAGTLTKPSVQATLDVKGLHAGDVAVADATAMLRVEPTGTLPAAPIHVEGAGRLSGLDVASVALPSQLRDTVDWRVAGLIDLQKPEVSADVIEIAAPGATLSASATATPDGATGTARLTIADLAPFDGGALAGALDLAVDLHAARDGTGTAVLSGAIDRPAIGEPWADALLGQRLDIGGTIERRADGTIEASDLAIDGPGLTLSADGRRAADGKITARFQAKVPRLAALDPRFTGTATATGNVSGPPNALRGDLLIESPSLSAAGVHIEAARVKIALQRLAPLALSLDATLRAQKIDASLRATASYEEGVLRVPSLAASAAGARVDGSMRLAAGRVEGKLTGNVPDLRPWSQLAGMDLAGRVHLDAAATGNRASATLEGSGLRIGTATMPTAKLGMRSDRPGRYALDVAASGTAGAPFVVNAAANLAIARGGYDLDVTKLQGTVAGTPVALRAPLAAAWRGGTLRFNRLALRLADGSVTGDGEMAGGKLSLHLKASELPVEPMARLGGARVMGTLGFELSVSGTRTAPQGTLVVDGENLRFAEASRPGLPALGAVLQANWRGGRLDIKGRLAGPRGAAIGWTGSAPLVLERDGFGVSLPQSGAVEAHLEGEGQLGAFSDVLPSGEDRIDGTFAIDVRVSGTVGNPDASGRITIRDGRYENFFTGAILRNINVALEGQRDRLVLREFTARDESGGSLNANGAVDLSAEGGPTLAFAANLLRLRVLNRDEGRALASGSLRLSGSLAAPHLDASLTVDQAEIAVPERLPQSARPVAAIVIDSATGQTLSKPEETGPSPLLTLALNVQVQIPGKTFVRGRGLDSEWRGRLQITGTAAAPIITGRLDVVRGTYDFLGKSATLTDGTITFFGGPTIDPTINITARVPSSDVTAIVGITGTATRPTINLSSEPPLPRDEILSRVLFGSSMSQISPAQGLQIAGTAASLAGGGDIDVLSKLRTGLGLDRLTLGQAGGSSFASGVPGIGATPGSTAPTGLGTAPLAAGSGAAAGGVAGTTVSAGKYVANGVYVGVNQGLQAGSSTVTVDIDVSRHISIETQAGQQSGTGLGVNWKLDY